MPTHASTRSRASPSGSSAALSWAWSGSPDAASRRSRVCCSASSGRATFRGTYIDTANAYTNCDQHAIVIQVSAGVGTSQSIGVIDIDDGRHLMINRIGSDAARESLQSVNANGKDVGVVRVVDRAGG